MKRMDLKRTVTAFSLAATMIISSIAMGGDMNSVEAASKKQNVITKDLSAIIILISQQNHCTAALCIGCMINDIPIFKKAH